MLSAQIRVYGGKLRDNLRQMEKAREIVAAVEPHKPGAPIGPGVAQYALKRNNEMEVGKKYTITNDGVIYECIHILPDGRPVVRYFHDNKWLVHQPNYWLLKDCIEYKELRTGRFWVNVYPKGSGTVGYINKSEADERAVADRIACVEVKWTEGEGL